MYLYKICFGCLIVTSLCARWCVCVCQCDLHEGRYYYVHRKSKECISKISLSQVAHLLKQDTRMAKKKTHEGKKLDSLDMLQPQSTGSTLKQFQQDLRF